ncbi:hypothetical protein ABIC65_003335 [Sphingomonas trueperi]|uniref:spike base protein, RCAP_Rcc01079 family n=1 Tax=Sphingomonas trueperi TaxID=53317 RepID=UPI00339B1EDD
MSISSTLARTTPATKATPIVPSDTVAIDPIPKAIYVGTGGAIKMQGPSDDTPEVWKNVQAGSILPYCPKLIFATGTTAADMLALYN